MPLTDSDRIFREVARPRVVQLWWALQPLKSIVSFMNTGAHPDDETSAMLAALGFRDGMALSYACANRGEGGQNDIGTEMTADLGTLRTREMERAADVLNMRLYWLGEHPDDTIFDFGFSKSGKETLAKWGDERTLARFVDIIRAERPDIICPTFLDIPGQHGHHRAMTEMAHRVMNAAADPSFSGSERPVWQVSKLYLPAWSGAGQAYDDDLPPPPATVTVAARGADPITGWSWERIGQQSRAFHRTQGMGRWVAAGTERDWPLHLADDRVGTCGDEASLFDNLPRTLVHLADHAGVSILAGTLSLAQRELDSALASFPDGNAVLDHATRALGYIRDARTACPEKAWEQVIHRLDRKEQQLSHVIRLAAGVEVIGRTGQDWLHPGNRTALTVETRIGSAEALSASIAAPSGWEVGPDWLQPGADALPSDPYPATHDPAAPRAPALVARVTTNGVTSESRVALETTPVVLPATTVTLSPATAVLNTAMPDRALSLDLSDAFPTEATAALALPSGWTAEPTETGFRIVAPDRLTEGMHRIGVTLDGVAAQSVERIVYPHIAPAARCFPAELTVLAVNATMPDVAVGYVGGGNDRVAHWLRALGARVTELSDADLASDTTLAALDTIVIGIFAIRSRPALAEALPRLHTWIEAGGNLVTLYHRPWDNWDPDTTPPRRLEIGQPSLRWRVTDEAAEVTVLAPDHALLSAPNGITDADWDGWHKERGLYFASAWDEAYEPLLEMADPDEAPHRGALLAARIGTGQHVHCALILHHQMEKLVPGGFRLMANLLARPE